MADRPVVVVLNDFAYVQGGASKVAIDEAVALAEAGWHVVFLAAVGPVGSKLKLAGIPTICLGQPQLGDVAKKPGVAIQAMWNRTAYRRIIALLGTLDREKTIVHLHGSTKALSASPVRAVAAAGFRLVCTLHDFFAACPNGAFFDYAAMAPCSRIAMSAGCVAARCDKRHHAHKLFRVARGIVQRGVGHFPAAISDFIVLSDLSERILRPYLPEAAHFHRLGNIIDVGHAAPVAVGRNQMLLYVGRLDEEKGVRLLADAAGGAELVFVGDGPLRAELAARPGVTVTGWLPPEDVAVWLGRARCLVFPSLWFETFGLVVDEAAARGVPAVVSDITAAAERVVNGVTGWHFRSGDRAALVAALARTRDEGAVADAGAHCYAQFWRNPPTRRNHAASLTRVYRKILDRQALLF